MPDQVALTAIALASAGAGSAPPKEVQLVPLGTFTGRDGRGPYRVRDIAHARKIVAASRAYVGTGDLPIDYDHQLNHAPKNGAPAPAAGWITALHARTDGIWGDVEWTERAADHLKQREYRHLSPVITYDPKTGNVMRITHAALTNVPNLELQALASQQESPTMNDETAARIRALLSLDDAADDATVLQAITNLVGQVVRAAGATAPDAASGAAAGEACCSATAPVVHPQVAAMAQRLGATERQLHETSVQAAITTAMREGKITPAMKGWAMANCAADPDGFQALMSVMPVIVSPGAMLTGQVPDRSDGLTDNQSEICRNLNLTADAFGKTR